MLLSSRGGSPSALLCDFGGSKQGHGATTFRHQSAGYADPEYVNGGARFTWHHDIFSLGRLTLQVLSGLEIHVAVDLAGKWRASPVPDPRALWPAKVAKGLLRLYKECTGPKGRRPDASAFCQQIERIAAAGGAQVTPRYTCRGPGLAVAAPPGGGCAGDARPRGARRAEERPPFPARRWPRTTRRNPSWTPSWTS